MAHIFLCLFDMDIVMLYYAYFHSIMNYGLIFWVNSSHRANIFTVQRI